jgi:uncharacterized protein (DUF4415 family)
MDDSTIDYTDIPALDEVFFARAKLMLPNAVQLDSDVLRWFRKQNPDYTEQINRILRDYIARYDHAA